MAALEACSLITFPFWEVVNGIFGGNSKVSGGQSSASDVPRRVIFMTAWCLDGKGR